MTTFEQAGIQVTRTPDEGGSRRLVDSLARYSLKRHYANLLAKTDNVNMRICLGMTSNIQMDSVDEYSLARQVERDKPSQTDLLNISDATDLLFADPARKSVFLLISNLFNRADEIGERALVKNTTDDTTNSIDLSKLVIGQYQDASGEQKNISFLSAYQAIKESANTQGLSTEKWDALFGQIVRTQLESIQTLKKGKSYSVLEALEYKHKTIGSYAKLLGNIMYGDNDRKINLFVESMMQRQAADDLFDVSQDVNSQLNPFIAMLEANNLLEEFKHFSTLENLGPLKWLVQLTLARPNKFAFFGSTNIFALFAQQHPELAERINEIKAGYLI